MRSLAITASRDQTYLGHLFQMPCVFAHRKPHVISRCSPVQVLEDYFELGAEIGKGRYGTVYECKDRSSGAVFACKAISKAKLKTRAEIITVRREVEIMHTLLGVENCVQLKVRQNQALVAPMFWRSRCSYWPRFCQSTVLHMSLMSPDAWGCQWGRPGFAESR